MPEDNKKAPWGLKWRSSTTFIITTVAVGLFTDLFLYGLIVPVLPFMLKQRIGVSDDKIQSYVSALLAAFAGASLAFSVPAGVIADKTSARQLPFLAGLAALLGATILLAVGQTMAVLVVARILQGISGAIVWTVGLAMVLDTVGPSKLGGAMGTIFSFISVGELAGPVFGGILYQKTGYAGVFGLGAAFLVVDFALRLLLIEKKTAAQYGEQDQAINPREHGTRGEDDEHADEEDALLGKSDEDKYKIPEGQNRVIKAFPLLYCLSNFRLVMGLGLAFVQAMTLASFDATIPTEAKDLLGFDSLKAGLLFIALDVPYLALGTLAGKAVDRYGTKPVSIIGFAYLVPVLILLRLPSANILDQKGTIILYSAMLFLNGIGLAIIVSPSIVDTSDVVQKYDKANPGFFGENGPYAQLYGFNSLLFSAGLTIGPVLSGSLRDTIGYGNMNLVLAIICAVVAVLSYFYIGGRPKTGQWLRRR